MKKRVAVVLFNLGGPDRLEAVEPFLFNLFNDPAIIGLPRGIRYVVARLIAARRKRTATEIYRRLGGGSPLRQNTEQQGEALAEHLRRRGVDARVFVCMRYWHPMSEEVARQVAAFAPEETVLLPLYPQFSTTTTGSSVDDWRRWASKVGRRWVERSVCCYPTNPGFIAAQVRRVREAIGSAALPPRVRFLFSAHGLPQRIVDRGDPYVWQVRQTVEAVAKALDLAASDYTICYQSRVGPVRWTGPQLREELVRAGKDGVGVVVVPVSFVSEHSETLVELDIEYRRVAGENKVPGYLRIPAVGVTEEFVKGLADLVEMVLGNAEQIGGICGAANGKRMCPSEMVGCPCQALVK
jgi:ferrochelatase